MSESYEHLAREKARIEANNRAKRYPNPAMMVEKLEELQLANPDTAQVLSDAADLIVELASAALGVLPAAEHAHHTGAFPDKDGGDWWSRIKRVRAAVGLAEGQ